MSGSDHVHRAAGCRGSRGEADRPTHVRRHRLRHHQPRWAECGKAPVLVARVGATIECKDIDGMKYTLRDWHMREIGRGQVKDGVLNIPGDKAVFVIELTRGQ